MDKKMLLGFIAKAHRHTYAASKEVRKEHRCRVPILDGHKDYQFSEGNLSYHDSYSGSLWAPGREVVFFEGNPVWCMSYQGQHNEEFDIDFFQEKAFIFLKEALMNFDDAMPFRGPKEFVSGDFRYTFEMKGDYDYFIGQERIFYKGKSVFFQDVMGSLIR